MILADTSCCIQSASPAGQLAGTLYTDVVSDDCEAINEMREASSDPVIC